MIVNMYSFKDTLTQSYGDIKLCVNDAHAKREYATMFQSSVNKPFIKDIQVYKLGTYNLSTGEIVADIEFVGNATDILAEYVQGGDNK